MALATYTMIMKRLLSLFSATLVAALIVPSVAFAAKPTPAQPPAPTELKGYDISYPQCGNKDLKNLPTDQYFAIVGVNGGTAATYNSCLADQLVWANKAKTGSNQPKVQLYVNTANPAQDTAYNWASWPTSGNTPYGPCTGVRTNDAACSWQYGWNRSAETEAYFVGKAQAAGISTNTGNYTWWLDVETMNSWQTGSNLALNTAALEGFAAYYQAKGSTVGLYSTAVQWNSIVGSTVNSDSNLNGSPNWRPSGASLSNAVANCSVAPLTANGYISITQYVVKSLDTDHSCI